LIIEFDSLGQLFVVRFFFSFGSQRTSIRCWTAVTESHAAAGLALFSREFRDSTLKHHNPEFRVPDSRRHLCNETNQSSIKIVNYLRWSHNKTHSIALQFYSYLYESLVHQK